VKWPVAKIDQIAATGTGGTPPRKEGIRFFGGTIPWIKSGELKDAVLNSAVETITDAALAESNAKLVPPGAVLIALYGATVGRTALLGFEAATNQAVCHIIPDRRLAEPRFVWYGLRAELPALLRKRVGGAQPNISQHIIRSTTLPLPALREQQRIVNLLEQADGLRRQRVEADALADRILPALFHQIFGDPATNPKGWPNRKLGDVIVETSYGTSNPSNASGEGLPVLRMNNIESNGRLNLADLKHVTLDEGEVEKHSLRDGDLLFNRTNSKELVGKTGLWRGGFPAVAASYLIRVRVDISQAVPDYIWAWMNTRYFKQRLFDIARRAVGMANINATELRAMPLLVPVMALQHAFAARLRSLDGLAARREEAAQQLQKLFSTLLHRAFAGDLTAKWREAHLRELAAEMEHQARLLKSPTEE
jgi:type I restriction enzyme S subunit